ncbi:MAG: T9SS type A sorting domain-containing protein [bacterium]
MAFSQKSLNVLNYEILDFPQVQSDVFIFNDKYIPENNFKIENLSASDAGSGLAILNLINPEQTPFTSVSLTICVDLAIGSQAGNTDWFNLAKYTAKLLSGNVLNGTSDCSLTSFDQFSYINLDFTKDSKKLNDGIELLEQSQFSNYATGLINYPIGAIAEANTGKFDKALVLITDRKNVTSYKYVIELLNQRGIKFYCLTLGDEVKEEFQIVADSTGGKYFGNINDTSQVVKSVNSCLAYIYNYKPAKLIWQSLQNCEEEHLIQFDIAQDKISDSIIFILPDKYRPFFEVEPKYLNFSAVIPGMSKELEATITARNDDILITDMKFTSDYLQVTIGAPDASNPVIRIKKDEPHPLTIKFAPLDSALIFDSLVIVSNACYGEALLITGGFPNTPPKQRNLTLTKPVCGETLVIGDTVSVEWTGVLPKDVIQLEYTLDNGDNWNVLAKNINGLKFQWVVPDEITDGCIIRAIQLWPNNVGQTMDLWHRQAVQSANFNEIGDMVVSASTDLSAKVWNSNNGFELHKLIGHTAPLRWANFSPDGNYVITASDDSTVKIWDITNPEEKFSKSIMTLSGHLAEVKSANYSPDGKYIITASWDGTAKIWDAKTGDFIQNLTKETFRLWFAEFSSDGKYVVTVGNSSKIRIWKTDKWELYRTFSFNNGSVIHADFSPDGKKLVSAGWFGRAVMWDIETGDTLFTITHTDSISGINPINSANFDYTGKYFLTTSIDKFAKMWDSETGNLVKTLKEHTNAVQFAVFNFDGSRILTSSWDSTAKIWNLDKRDLQMDSTDCPIDINHADVLAFDHKLPDVITGQTNQFYLDTFLLNRSPFLIRIKDIRLKGKNPGDFQIVNKEKITELDSLSVQPLEIIFSPLNDGLRECDIEIDIPGETLVSKISGNGFQPELAVSTDYIDFGKVDLGEFKDTMLTLLIKNVSSKTIKILSVSIPGPDIDHFFIIKGSETTTLAPNEGKDFILRFMPEKAERSNSIISIKYDAYGQEAIIPLLGEGVLPIIDTATISITGIEAKEGSIIDVPIKVAYLNNSMFRETIEGFTVDLQFNGTMLEPMFKDYSSRVEEKSRILTFDLPSVFNESNILKTLKFRVALGNDTITELKLSNLRLKGKGKTAITLSSAEFKLIDFCKKGGLRLFDADGKIYLAQNKPNPVEKNTSIEFEVYEDGHTFLYLVDMLGKVVKTLQKGNLPAGSYTLDLELPELPNGSYYYILQTPSYRISKRLDISR